MKLRVLSILAVASALMTFGVEAEDRQWIQVKIYHLTSEASEKLFDATFAEAVLPALKREGVEQVGVFRPVTLGEGDEEPARERYVVMAMESPEKLVEVSAALGRDSDFLEKAGDYLGVSKEDAVYSRVESSLLYAFEGMPRLMVPEKAEETDEARLFELRMYESYSEAKGKRKVEMFNEGELAIFNEVGLRTVFFGEAVAAKNLPQLTYLAVYEDEADREEAWARFLASPKWETLKTMEKYQDTVSKIISQHLKPLPYSPIQ